MLLGLYKYVEQEYGSVEWSKLFYANSAGAATCVINLSKINPTAIILHSISWNSAAAGFVVTFSDNFGQTLLTANSVGVLNNFVPYIIETNKLTITASAAPTLFICGYQYIIRPPKNSSGL